MFKELAERCDVIEECYEFMLAYAGQGLPGEAGKGASVRDFLGRSATALSGLAEVCAEAVKQEGLEQPERYQAFVSMLRRDAQDSLAAIEIVLAQPTISSQLIDNLNASIHLRALLTDLFLIDEIVKVHQNAGETASTA
ncbi:MAG: hypothetical protein ABI833_04305 [Acidobacteriota bacterium]